jgi:hypothetical protein
MSEEQTNPPDDVTLPDAETVAGIVAEMTGRRVTPAVTLSPEQRDALDALDFLRAADTTDRDEARAVESLRDNVREAMRPAKEQDEANARAAEAERQTRARRAERNRALNERIRQRAGRRPDRARIDSLRRSRERQREPKRSVTRSYRNTSGRVCSVNLRRSPATIVISISHRTPTRRTLISVAIRSRVYAASSAEISFCLIEIETLAESRPASRAAADVIVSGNDSPALKDRPQSLRTSPAGR